MKKLISLLLVLTLCVLSLAACGTCTEHEDKDGDGICNSCDAYIPVSYLDALKSNPPEETYISATQAKSYEVIGDPITGASSVAPLASTDELMITKKTVTKVIPAELNGGTATTTDVVEYRVYRVADGQLLFTKSVEADEDFTPDTATVAITVILGGYTNGTWEIPEKYFAVVTTTKANDVSISVYNQSGSQVASKETIATGSSTSFFNIVEFFSDEYFAIDGMLYREANGIAEALCDYKLLNLKNRLANYTVTAIGDKFFAVGVTNYSTSFGKYIVFDKSFNVLHYYDIPTYSGWNISYYLLGNGNLLVSYHQSKSVRDLLEDDTYDYVVGSTVYNRDFFVYDYASGELNQIDDLPFSSFSVSTVGVMNDMFDDGGLGIKCDKYTDESIITGFYIENGRVITNESRAYFLSNDGTLRAQLEGIDGVSAMEFGVSYLFPQDVYVISLPYGDYLYSKDGERIGEFPGGFHYTEYNAKWFLYNNTLIDFSLNEVYTIDTNEYTIIRFAKGVVYLSRHFEKDDTNPDSKAYTQYYAYDGTLREVFRIDDGDLTKSVFFKDTYYYTAVTTLAEGAEAVTTYTVYSSAGVALLTLPVQNTATELRTVTVSAGLEQCVIREAITNVAATTVTYKYHVVK